MKCLECSVKTRKYKCIRCNQYCCSFDCFKKHKNVECTPEINEIEDNFGDKEQPSLFQFTTEDTVDPAKLAELANSETLKDLLRNRHLREFIKEVDSSLHTWKKIKIAMLEPLFIEFADECLKVIEPIESTSIES